MNCYLKLWLNELISSSNLFLNPTIYKCYWESVSGFYSSAQNFDSKLFSFSYTIMGQKSGQELNVVYIWDNKKNESLHIALKSIVNSDKIMI